MNPWRPAEVETFARNPYENRLHEVKGAISWDTICFRGDRLRDIAAIANSGGGILLIGRDSPSFKSGSISAPDLKSYDITNVATVIRRFIEPVISVDVYSFTIGGDQLIALDIPTITRSPAIITQAFSCSDATHKAHFLPGDVFVRTPAGQTQKLSSNHEMNDLFERVVDFRITEIRQRYLQLGGR